MPLLPYYLYKLSCQSNKLYLLPPLNQFLEILDCSNNKLISLPLLFNGGVNETNYYTLNLLGTKVHLLGSLTSLKCNNNQLKSLPYLHSLYKIECWQNPIYEIIGINIDEDDILFPNKQYYDEIIKKSNIFTHFREFYFLSKLRKKFLSWMWKSREKSIQEKYHFKYLEEVIKNNENNPNFDLDNDFLNTW
jgi:hypothetical protein